MCVGVFWLGMVPFSWCWTRTASHEENLAKSSFSDPLYLLSILFRIFGLPIDPQDHLYWKLYHFLIILCLLISFMGLVVSAIDKLNEDIFNTISAILFSFNGLLSYLCLSITVYSHQHNLLEIIKAIAKYSPAYSNSNNLLNFCNDSSLGSSSTQYLKFYSYKWLRIALAIGLLSYSLLFVAYGRHGDTHFFDVGKNPGWHLGNILYPYFNAGWLMPMVVVRVGCHFLEEKLFSFIEYLEEPESRAVASQRSQSLSRPRDSVSRDCVLSSRVLSAIHSLTSSDAPIVSQQHNPTIGSFSRISIKQIMSWYDELYALNQLLSNALSLIIFQMIICLFPVVVFMLQVISPFDNLISPFSAGFPLTRYFTWDICRSPLLDLSEFIRPLCCDSWCSTN
jgi:hypothetical protein